MKRGLEWGIICTMIVRFPCLHGVYLTLVVTDYLLLRLGITIATAYFKMFKIVFSVARRTDVLCIFQEPSQVMKALRPNTQQNIRSLQMLPTCDRWSIVCCSCLMTFISANFRHLVTLYSMLPYSVYIYSALLVYSSNMNVYPVIHHFSVELNGHVCFN